MFGEASQPGYLRIQISRRRCSGIESGARFLIVMSFFVVFAINQVHAQEKKASTPEERQKVVEIVDILESQPLSNDAKKYRGILLKWIDTQSDISFRYCVDLMGGVGKIKGDYSREMIAQLIFSEAKFLIENPDKANDDEAINFAGLKGVLRTYQALRIAKPEVRFEPLDELLNLQEKGQLADHIRTTTKGCRSVAAH